MCKLRRYIYLNRVPFGARQISYGRKSLVKLGVGQDIFKNTSEERPLDKYIHLTYTCAILSDFKATFWIILILLIIITMKYARHGGS